MLEGTATLDRLKWLLCAHFLLCLLSGHSSSLWRPTHVLEMQGCTVSFHMHMSAVLVVEFLQRTLAGEAEPAGGHTHTHEVPGLSSRGGGGQGGRGEVGGGLDCPLRRWVRREAGKVIGSASTDSNTLADWVSASLRGQRLPFTPAAVLGFTRCTVDNPRGQS